MDKDTLIAENGPFLILLQGDKVWELRQGQIINLAEAVDEYHKALATNPEAIELWENWPRSEPRQVLGYYNTLSAEEDSL